jgi:hypothetical protein
MEKEVLTYYGFDYKTIFTVKTKVKFMNWNDFPATF